MKTARRWVGWKLVWNAKKGAWDKVPINPWSKRNAKANRPDTWGTFEAALAALTADAELAGLGYEFEKGAGEFGLDLDDCRDPNTGAIAPWAQEVIDLFGTYAEVSPSGTGVKLIGRGKIPYCRKLHDREAYDAGRFFTVTGRPVPGSPAAPADCQAVIDEHFTRLFPPAAKKSTTPRARSEGNVAAGEPDDDKLIEKIRASGQGPKFAALFDRGDTSEYKNDDSRADLALCCILAWWARKDAERIDRLFRRSKLFRDKWDEHRGESTYGALTVAEAIATTEGEYDPNHRVNVMIRGFAGEPARAVPADAHEPAQPNAGSPTGTDGAPAAPDPDEPDDEGDEEPDDAAAAGGADAEAEPAGKEKDKEDQKTKAAASRLVELSREAGGPSKKTTNCHAASTASMPPVTRRKLCVRP